jgi:hypothetical protein
LTLNVGLSSGRDEVGELFRIRHENPLGQIGLLLLKKSVFNINRRARGGDRRDHSGPVRFPPIKGGGSSTTPSFIKSNIPYNRVDVARGQDCRQSHFDVRDESISFKEFLLLIFHFYSTSCAIIRW